MVGLNVSFQLGYAWLQNRKGPKKEMAKEMLIVLSSLKPGVDAYRVANGYKQPAYATFSPEVELGEERRSGRGGSATNTAPQPTPRYTRWFSRPFRAA
jgi:hypothetical protein